MIIIVMSNDKKVSFLFKIDIKLKKMDAFEARPSD